MTPPAPPPLNETLSSTVPGISCIQFDDTRIVSGSWDKTIKVHSYLTFDSIQSPGDSPRL